MDLRWYNLEHVVQSPIIAVFPSDAVTRWVGHQQMVEKAYCSLNISNT